MSRDEILMEIEDYCDSKQCIDCVFYTIGSECPFKVVTGYPLTGQPRVFSCQGTWAKLPVGRKKGMTTAW